MYIQDQYFNEVADLSPDWVAAFGDIFERVGMYDALVFVMGA